MKRRILVRIIGLLMLGGGFLMSKHYIENVYWAFRRFAILDEPLTITSVNFFRYVFYFDGLLAIIGIAILITGLFLIIFEKRAK